MEKTLAIISGNKTYIAGIISILLGVYTSNSELIMLGLVGMGLRNAIK